jgi:DNA polymerase delta subunit OB-fold domain
LAKSDDDAHRDSADQETLKVVVIGTIYKNQPLKPNILKELSEEQVPLTLVKNRPT